MPFTKIKCEKCGKDAVSERQFEIGKETVHLLKCGHLLRKAHLIEASPDHLVSLDGKKLYPFQSDGVRFVEKSGGRALIADEMGLGKTVQALATIALHPDEMQPVVYFLKSSLKIQWQHEIMRWVSKSEEDHDIAMAQVIETSKDILLPGAKHYIFSYDILRRFKDGDLKEKFEKRGVKTVVIDETQQIKNWESQRARQVRALCKNIPNVIALSGTPIKNNASEYFSILNILKPEMFPTYRRFMINEVDFYFNGYGYKVGGLRNPSGFLTKTKNFLIRREREEVMPDLPTVDRRFHFDALSEEVEAAYKAQFEEFRDEYYSGSSTSKSAFIEGGTIIAYLSKMRHLTGLSKIDPCVEFVEEFLSETNRRITIFVHHKDVSEILERKINKVIATLREMGWKHLKDALTLRAELNSQQREDVVTKFMGDDDYRVLIASTLASGEGLNLQKCSDCIILERQWNPANEEQAEARFIRIGATAQTVTATYFVAVGTVDEFFSKLVEQKREIVASTLGGESVPWDQSSLMRELADILASQGGKAWGW